MTTDWRGQLASRLAPLGLRPEREAEIVDELAQHLDEQVRELVAGGAERPAAIAQALADLDAPGVLAHRLARIEAASPFALPPPGAPSRGRWLSARWLDIRQSIRGLRRTPGFTAAVLITMALTIGPTTAMLSIGNWLLWRPVPAVANPDRLGIVYFGSWREDGRGVSPYSISPLNIADILAASTTLQALAGTQELSDSVTIEGRLPENMEVAHADANLFETLGVRPAAGRFFTPEEDRLPYGAFVAVLGDGLARRAFGSPQAAVGQPILLNGLRLEVVGVAPPRFRGITPLSDVQVWYPGAAYRRVHHFSSISPVVTRRDGTFYEFVARLRSGATFEAAQAELDVLAAALLERHPDENSLFKTVRARAFPGLGPRALSRDRYHTMVQRLLVIGAVLVVLGCANVANLLIFRGVRRAREHAVRLALGAGRARLLQLQLTESCLLALGGAALGAALAGPIARLILTLMLPGLNAADVEPTVPIDQRVLLATLGVAVACGLAAGLLPAWITASRALATGLSQAGTRGTPRGRRVRAAFASLQLALSLALLVGALLMVSTVRGLQGVALGFVPDGVSVHYVDLGGQGYTPPRALQYVRDLDAALAASGRVSAVSYSYSYPLASGFFNQARIPGGGSDDAVEVNVNGVTEDHFTVLGIPVLRGRAFAADEALASGDASGDGVVISHSLAARLFGETEPLGRPLVIGGGRNARTVVVTGVAGDVREDLVTGEAELSVYEPLARTVFFALRPTILVRSALPLAEIVEIVRAAGSRVDPAMPIYGHRPLQTVVDRELSSQRVYASVLTLLGGLGFLLAAVGLYGLLAQSVAERTREFGIRMAIGASRRQVFALVLRNAALIGAVGGTAGLGLALLGARLIESQLWGVTAREPAVFAAATVALLLVVVAAAAWPARAATRVQPVEALRVD
jgi:predicted permease